MLDPESLQFLAGLTAATIEASRVRPGEQVSASYPGNSSGCTLIRPGGRACYPAVWTQDFSMTLGTGYVTPEEMENHLLLIARAQHGPQERHLESGAVIPPFSVPDHVLFDGSPVYYPGTYSSGEDQGGERWGIVPPTNNQYDFTVIAHHLWKRTGRTDFLEREVDGLSLIERLRRAFHVPRHDPATGLIETDEARRAVGFIFYDSIYMTGKLFFASLLRWRTAHQLAQLEEALGHTEEARSWREQVASIPGHLPAVFGDPARIGGWLKAATGVSGQPDVWGTIYALFLGVLDDATARAARVEIVRALKEGTICYAGAVRHVPLDHDASSDSAWERTHTPRHRYQNGAFWHTPTGWLVAVLVRDQPVWATRIFDEMIAHLRQQDFRQGEAFCAPWECIGPDEGADRNPLFLASVTLPYAVLKNLNDA